MTLGRRGFLGFMAAGPSMMRGVAKAAIGAHAAPAVGSMGLASMAGQVGAAIDGPAPVGNNLVGDRHALLKAARALVSQGKIPERVIHGAIDAVAHRCRAGQVHPSVAPYRSFAPWLRAKLSFEAMLRDELAVRQAKFDSCSRVSLDRLLSGAQDQDELDYMWNRW